LFLLFLNSIIFIFGKSKNHINIIKIDREPKNEKNEQEIINKTIAITTIQTQNKSNNIIKRNNNFDIIVFIN